jgi:hypothetical protein
LVLVIQVLLDGSAGHEVSIYGFDAVFVKCGIGFSQLESIFREEWLSVLAWFR